MMAEAVGEDAKRNYDAQGLRCKHCESDCSLHRAQLARALKRH